MQSIYEIYEVPGDRWANMITFGVRVKDEFRDMDFENFNFGLSWDTTEFSYVPGTFEAGLATTQSMEFAETVMQDARAASYGHLSAAFVADSTYRMNDNGTPDDYTDDFKELDNPFNYDVPQYEIGGKKYDPYIAKFMLERIDESSGENSFTHFSSYAYLEENVELGGFDEIPVVPNADAIAKFDYGPDNLKVNVANPIGTYAPNPELFVSDGTIADGLSIVPVDKMGDIVVFQVMMNVSYPTTLLDTLDHANSASIEITADEIFTDSVYQRVDDTGTVGAVTAHVRADGAATGTAITTEDKSAVDFWDQVDAIADGDGDFTALNTASTITLDFSNIGDGGQIAQDGKYVLAEFVARNSDAGFDYSYYNNDVDADTAASSISMYSQAILDGTLTRQIDDGSDVTVLGDTYYQNPFSFAARINSNDASTALKISVSDPGGSRYGEADFMSADYNGDGEVTSGDAYDILRTAAFMDPSDPDAGPFWSYVRDVDTASSLVNLGVAVPAEFDVDGNVINVPDLTPTITYDRTLDLFIGTDTVINATAVLTGDTDHNYMMLTSQQDPVLNHYDGFIGTWRAPSRDYAMQISLETTQDLWATRELEYFSFDRVMGQPRLTLSTGMSGLNAIDTVSHLRLSTEETEYPAFSNGRIYIYGHDFYGGNVFLDGITQGDFYSATSDQVLFDDWDLDYTQSWDVGQINAAFIDVTDQRTFDGQNFIQLMVVDVDGDAQRNDADDVIVRLDNYDPISVDNYQVIRLFPSISILQPIPQLVNPQNGMIGTDLNDTFFLDGYDLTYNFTEEINGLDGYDVVEFWGIDGVTNQFKVANVEAYNVTQLTGNVTFSMLNTIGMDHVIAGGPMQSVVNPSRVIQDNYSGNVSFVGDVGDKEIDFIGAITGTITTDTGGSVNLNLLADSNATRSDTDVGSGSLVTTKAHALNVTLDGAIDQIGTISAASANTLTIDASNSIVAQSSFKLDAAKAETVSIIAPENFTLHAASNLSGARALSIDTSGVFRDSSTPFLRNVENVHLSGARSMSGITFDNLVGAVDSMSDLTIVAAGLHSGLAFVGGLDAGIGDLTFDASALTGDLHVNSLDADNLTLSISDLGHNSIGQISAKNVYIDATYNLGGLTFTGGPTDIYAEKSVTIQGPNITATDVDIVASSISSSLTVNVNGGLSSDIYDIYGSANNKTLTVQGDGGLGSDVYFVTLADYTSDNFSTVTVDLSGIVTDNTSQSAVTVDISAETTNPIVLTGTKGHQDRVIVSGEKDFSEKGVVISNFEYLDINNDTTLTASSLSGQDIILGSSSGSSNEKILLVGTVDADTIDLSNIQANAQSPSISIRPGSGSDTVILSAHSTFVETIIFEHSAFANGITIVNGFESGIDKINLNVVTTSTDPGTVVSVANGDSDNTVLGGEVYFITSDVAGEADSSQGAFAAINAAGSWTDAGANQSATFVIVDDDSTSVFEYSVENATEGVQETELSLLASLDGQVTENDIIISKYQFEGVPLSIKSEQVDEMRFHLEIFVEDEYLIMGNGSNFDFDMSFNANDWNYLEGSFLSYEGATFATNADEIAGSEIIRVAGYSSQTSPSIEEPFAEFDIIREAGVSELFLTVHNLEISNYSFEDFTFDVAL